MFVLAHIWGCSERYQTRDGFWGVSIWLLNGWMTGLLNLPCEKQNVWVFFSTHFSLSCIFQEIVSSFSLLLRQKKPKESFFVLLFTLNFMFNSSLGPRWVHLAMFPGLTAPHRPSAPTFSGSHLSEEPSGAAPALWAALSLLLLPTQALFPHSSQTHFVRTYRVSWNLRHCWSWAALLYALPEKGKLHQLCRCQVRHFPLLAILKCEGNVYLSIAETW